MIFASKLFSFASRWFETCRWVWLFNRCEGFRRAHLLACSHLPCDEFLNNPYSPLEKDRVSFDQKIIRRSVFWVQRTVRTTTKSNQFQTSATREREGPSNLGPTAKMHIIEASCFGHFEWRTKQFYLCLWLDKCSSLETKGRGIFYVKSEIVA